MHSRLRLIYFVIFSIVSTFLYATSSPDYSTVDAREKKVPAKHLKSINTLVNYHVEDDYGDYQKVRAIYKWMIRIITWDNDSVRSDNKKTDIKVNKTKAGTKAILSAVFT